MAQSSCTSHCRDVAGDQVVDNWARMVSLMVLCRKEAGDMVVRRPRQTKFRELQVKRIRIKPDTTTAYLGSLQAVLTNLPLAVTASP